MENLSHLSSGRTKLPRPMPPAPPRPVAPKTRVITQWQFLKVGDQFLFNDKEFIKVKDTGYVFGIMNSKDKSGNWALIPVYANVEKL